MTYTVSKLGVLNLSRKIVIIVIDLKGEVSFCIGRINLCSASLFVGVSVLTDLSLYLHRYVCGSFSIFVICSYFLISLDSCPNWHPLRSAICSIKKLVSYSDADLLHPATEGTVKKDHTLGRVVRDHMHVLHPIMAQGAAAKVQPGSPRVGVGAKVLTMKSTQGNQTEIGLLVSEPFERRLPLC